MNANEFETFIVQVEPDGLACLSAMAIKSPRPIEELCGLIRLGEKKVRQIMFRLERFGYAGQAAPIDATRWSITDKARAIVAALFQNLIGRGSDPRQLPLLTGSNPDHLAPAGSDPAFVEFCARGARRLLIHSDQIIDQISDSDHDLEMNETLQTPRDVQAVAEALDRHSIKDLPSKPGKPSNNNRTKLLSDSWVTPERIDAAIERARNNPKRLSPNPIGLAVAELIRHRPEIDEWISAHQAEVEEAEPIEINRNADESYLMIARTRAEIMEIEAKMNTATWDDHQLLSAQRQSAYTRLHQLIEDVAA